MESVESFAARARAWLAEHMPRARDGHGSGNAGLSSDERELARIARCRELQRTLFDGGLAGICVPRDYGGQGLTAAHQSAFNREIGDYDYPSDTQIPTFSPCMAVILEFGSEDQKQRHIPPILKGETYWMQLLSEPSGGSDVAGALTTAVRDGQEWVLNGSKIWTTGAWWADWGLCLARTNWDVPKHRGLTVFVLELRQPGIEIHRIEMVNGSREFCQEFMTDVRIPDSQRLGEVDEGWTIGTRWMYHERAVSAGSVYVTAPAGVPAVALEALDPGGGADGLLRWAQSRGRLGDTRVKELIGESHTIALVGTALRGHIAEEIRTGSTTDHASAINRLWYGTAGVRKASIAFELMGATAVAWSDEEEDAGRIGDRFLMRQAACIGGGTTEMSRNVISERVLGMPRERSEDREVPFREVPRSTPSRQQPQPGQREQP
jgi:alkylation response protein AidB-like acyl-CoA dehydrogenase